MEQTTPETSSIDIDAASDSIASDLGFGSDSEPEQAEQTDALPEGNEVPHETVEAAPVEVESNTMPQSWKKEWEADWKATPKAAQDRFLEREKQMLNGLEQYKEHNEFGRQIKDVVRPYEQYLQSQGVDGIKAVQYLLSAQYRLSNGDQNTKIQMIRDLAKGVGINFDQISGQNPQNNELDPLWNEVKGLKSTLNARIEAEHEQTRQKVSQDVNAFASDPANMYFDEVAEEVIGFIKNGADLQTAYKKAVWANEATRAKEIARIQTESEAKLKPKLKEEALKAQRAISSNVRSRDTGRTPTAPLGTMEDTMREVLANRKARPH